MKLYTSEPKNLVRVAISKQLEPVEYFTLCECTAQEVEDFIKEIIGKQNLSPFIGGRKTQVIVRNAIGGKNGKCKSVSFRGLTAKETADLLKKELPTKEPKEMFALFMEYDLAVKTQLLNYGIEHSVHGKICEDLSDIRTKFILKIDN